MPRLEPLPPDTLHVAIDMQRLFAEATVWHTPALAGIVPAVVRLCVAMPAATAFLRFVVPERISDAPGRWRSFYERWPDATGERLDPAMIGLVEPLARLAGPDTVFDKPTFSMFGSPAFAAALDARRPGALVFSGVETDVCVLASVLGAVDLGYRCVVAADAVASGSVEAHEAVLLHLLPRQSPLVELWAVDEITRAWALAAR